MAPHGVMQKSVFAIPSAVQHSLVASEPSKLTATISAKRELVM